MRKVKPIDRTPQYRDDLVGYARVSTEEQNLDMQLAALEKAGVRPDNIHTEKTSGAALRRPGRDIAVKMCRPGDTLVVWKFDRISRSVLDLLLFIEKLEKDGISIWSIQDGFDTKSPIGRAMVTLSGVFAQLERDLTAERTKAGVARAKERGVRFGRESKLTPKVRAEFERRYREGQTIPQIAVAMKISEPTFRRVYKRTDLANLLMKKPKGKS
jgi:DNA invertase Pin-like site-specific DNA recombinase